MTVLTIDHIVASPEIFDGKPHIMGRRIKVSFIAALHQLPEWTVEKIAHEFELSHAQIYAALAYYYDHQAEIELDIKQSEHALPDELGTVDTLLKQHGLQPDTFSYSSGEFFVSYGDEHPQYAEIPEKLKAIKEIEVVTTREIKSEKTLQKAVRFKILVNEA